MIKQYWWK